MLNDHGVAHFRKGTKLAEEISLKRDVCDGPLITTTSHATAPHRSERLAFCRAPAGPSQ